MSEQQELSTISPEETRTQGITLALSFLDTATEDEADFNVAFSAGCFYLASCAKAFIIEHNLPLTADTVKRVVDKLYGQLAQSITFVMNNDIAPEAESSIQST